MNLEGAQQLDCSSSSEKDEASHLLRPPLRKQQLPARVVCTSLSLKKVAMKLI